MSAPLSTEASILLKQLIHAYQDAQGRRLTEDLCVFSVYRKETKMISFPEGCDPAETPTTDAIIAELVNQGFLYPSVPGSIVYRLTQLGLAQR